ncbi:MAG TPA: MYG1 family protein [Candidatus Onthousia faecipullorum]|uniref:MYG1 family protein n=1 Tax=Candidatus Onthousia faecipullorum TaxID=2840887 RepID=A0A9D1KD42_9FIRM|nr:MYG1 family protein [Candidatus Onthousia faecipullorum]
MITLVKDINEADGITHNGTMHADEVFATAFLSIYFKNFKVARVSEVPEDLSSNTIIYDIGKGKFDHHQTDARVRENGIKYSSFGLLFEEYGLDYLKKLKLKNTKAIYNYLIKDFIEGIDAIDNGVFPEIKANYKVKTVSDIIKIFNPSYKSNDNEDEQFIKVVSLAELILTEELKNVIGKVNASSKVKKLLNKTKSSILILDEYLPYEETVLTSLSGKKIKFVIYPSNRGGYGIKTVPVSTTDKTSRVYFPKAWGGLTNSDLEQVTGIKGSLFCHTNRFLMTSCNLDTAIKLAEKAIDANEKE